MVEFIKIGDDLVTKDHITSIYKVKKNRMEIVLQTCYRFTLDFKDNYTRDMEYNRVQSVVNR